jgi:2-polyprenyl-3-methyl-5-hydroxy-6-metoxy-1,4-benzoquinol methylase
VLSENGYQIALYDPFYHRNNHVLSEKYDFIFASEVVEHFHHPMSEFQRLFEMLRPNGKLYIMTFLFNEAVTEKFENWYYKNDPTHVVIYHDMSF